MSAATMISSFKIFAHIVHNELSHAGAVLWKAIDVTTGITYIGNYLSSLTLTYVSGRLLVSNSSNLFIANSTERQW